MRRWLHVLLATSLLVALAAPAGAITNGEPDGDDHPYVGLLVFFDDSGTAIWRCTGTLLSETVVLTAGHCTEEPAASAELFLQADVDALGDAYPSGGDGISYSSSGVYVHPDYEPGAFYLHDLGIVTLADPVEGVDTFGTLPDEGLLDEYATRRGQSQQTFTAVGYGLQEVKPVYSADRVRYRSTLYILSLRGTAGIPVGSSVLFSNNPGVGRGTQGGTCFGDSGGPIFLGDSTTIVAVTSFGLNQNCAGTGGGYRIDQQDDLDWIATFL